MYRLLESIRTEKGELQNLHYHQARMNASVKELFGVENSIKLEKISVPEHCRRGLYKCRVVYSETIENIEFIPYQYPPIKSLKLIIDDAIDYEYKFVNRSNINLLLEKKGSYDDILIVKNNLITDTSLANIIFFNGKYWLTPALPLLKGTQRAKLLFEEKIIAADIHAEDLLHFQKARLINAMMRFEDEVDVEVNRIEF
ncbi:MAG TPA: aminotransferase class IV family protein [Bacteroidales bacterium]